MSRRLAIVSLLAIVAVSTVAFVLVASRLTTDGASTTPRERPAAFVSRTVALIVSDDYATAWDTLYPGHKKVAAKDEYVACELRSPVGMELGAVKVLRVASRMRKIPGDSKPVPVELVTLRLTITNPTLRTKSAFVHTFTAVADGDHWAWILTPSKYELYRSHGCGV